MSNGTTSGQIEAIIDKYALRLVGSSHHPSAHRAPGAMVGVYLNGEAYYFGDGSINDAGDPPTPDTIFGLGSVTKTFTTAILGQDPTLLNKSVDGLLPPGFDLSWSTQPTFAQLASFTGGINPSSPDVSTQEEFIAFVNGLAYPGSLPAAWQYSDSSIGLLGQTLMHGAGFTAFDAASTLEWYTQKLFGPLGMTSTFPAPVEQARLATAYEFADGAYKKTDYAGWCPWGTAGRMFSTARDMVNFIMAAVGVGTIGGNTVPQTVLDGIALSLQPQATQPKDDCGALTCTQQACAWMRWDPDPVYQTVICGKDGGLAGVSSYLAVNPHFQCGVILMTNMYGVGVPCPTISILNDLLPLAAAA